MVLIPPEIQIRSITAPCICHFKDKKHLPEGPPHFYVIIPVNDATDLVLTMITSQVQRRRDHYSRVNAKALDGLVPVDGNVLTFLNRESLIDCNSVELVPKVELQKMIDPEHGFAMRIPTVPDELKKRIVAAMKNSPIVKPAIKKLLTGL